MRTTLVSRYLIALIVFLAIPLQSQDLIVTSETDSLNATITDQDSIYVYFNYVKDGRKRKGILKKSSVETINHGYFAQAEVQENGTEGSISSKKEESYRFSISGGMGFLLAPLADGISDKREEHLRALKSGLNLAASIIYFYSEKAGVGVDYSRYSAESMSDDIPIKIFPNEPPHITPLHETYVLNYVGPSFYFRNELFDGDFNILAGLGLGYLHYFDEQRIDLGTVDITGWTIGVNYRLEAEYIITESLAAGLNLSLINGSLKKVKISSGTSSTIEELPDDQREGLHRININAGLRLYL